MNDAVNVETIKFKRPSSEKVEVGIRVSDNSGRTIIIDKDLNPIVHGDLNIIFNASYEGYLGDAVNYIINF